MSVSHRTNTLSLHQKKIDIFAILLLGCAGFIIAWFAQGTVFGKPFISWILFIVFPTSFYLFYRKEKPVKYILMGTFVLGFIFALVLETLAEFNGAWHVVNVIFPYRFPGGASLDAILGYVSMTFLMLVVYEHFLDTPHKGRAKFDFKRLAFALLPSTSIVMLLFILSSMWPEAITIPYLYLFAGIAAILPAVIIGFKKPKIYARMIKIMPYFFFIYLAFEYLAVSFSWWIYPSGEYLGYVSFLGVSFPFEELFFWMLFYAASIVAYYEQWIDDGR